MKDILNLFLVKQKDFTSVSSKITNNIRRQNRLKIVSLIQEWHTNYYIE